MDDPLLPRLLGEFRDALVIGQTHWFSIGEGRLALVNYLLTGYPT